MDGIVIDEVFEQRGGKVRVVAVPWGKCAEVVHVEQARERVHGGAVIRAALIGDVEPATAECIEEWGIIEIEFVSQKVCAGVGVENDEEDVRLLMIRG